MGSVAHRVPTDESRTSPSLNREYHQSASSPGVGESDSRQTTRQGRFVVRKDQHE